MKRPNLIPSKTSRSFGTPGLSARAAIRTRRAHIQQMTLRSKVLSLAVVAAIGAIFALGMGENPFAGAAVAAAIAVAAVIVVSAPQALIIAGILLAYAGFSIALSTSFIAAATVGSLFFLKDVFGGAVSLILASVLTAWVAVRHSRGRAWVTLAAALVASVVLGMALTLAFPPLGLYGAYISMALVLALRCGGWAWLTGFAAIAREKVKSVRQPVENGSDEILQAWKRRAGAELATAAVLDSLSAAHTIFHDVKVGKHPNALSHLVLGPEGVFLIASVSTAGPISETRAAGVQIPGVPVGILTTTLLEQRHLLAKRLKMRPSELSILIVVHGEKDGSVEPGLRRSLAVFSANDGEQASAQVVLVGADAIRSEIETGLAVLSSLSLKQAVMRARLGLSPAGAPAPSRWQHAPAVRVASMGEDGQAVAPSVADAEPASWLAFGAAVDITTSTGVLRDLRVAGDSFVDDDGRLVVPLCVEEEWQSARQSGRAPMAYPYPVSAIIPAE